MDKKRENSEWLERIVRDFVDHSSENSLGPGTRERSWDDPLIGISAGDDPIYLKFKEDIGSFYWTPLEIFSETFPSIRAAPHELSVLSWVLPQTEATKADNRSEGLLPSERWVRSRVFGEEANIKLARHVVAVLGEAGHYAVAPSLSPLWAWRNSENYGYASNWSERHAAFAAGLGTFGLCDGLITRRGKAMRCGSVVARIPAAVSARGVTDYREYCLFFSKGKCGVCISRCPEGAITREGHDKAKCREYLFGVVAGYAESRFGIKSYGCGLCQTGVPCESRIPLEKDLPKKAKISS